jgi:hypothetical protein
MDPEVDSCIANVIKAIEFPKAVNGDGVIQVNYPFNFSPALETSRGTAIKELLK